MMFNQRRVPIERRRRDRTADARAYRQEHIERSADFCPEKGRRQHADDGDRHAVKQDHASRRPPRRH